MPKNASPDRLESPESSSPIVTRAVAAALRGQDFASYPLPGWQRIALRALGALPQTAGRSVISQFQRFSSLPAAALAGLTTARLAAERLADYDGLAGPFPAVLVGAALGGAAAHLAVSLGGPFLPHAFVVTLRGGAGSGDVHEYFARSQALALEIAARNPDVLTVQHYDPVHDGWVTRFANHLRFKLLDLPPAYAAFIRQRLQPGGALVYLDCGARWLRYRVGERSVFQVGGWGGIPAREYLQGSERLERYARSVGWRRGFWRLEGWPLDEGLESEWGCEAGLGLALEAFCQREGYRFMPIALPAPADFSRLAFRAVQQQLARAGRQPGGALVEMFSQFDAGAVRRSGLLPLWLVFNTLDSLETLKTALPEFPDGKPIFFSPLATFSHTPDLVSWQEWETALDGRAWINAGARRSHYPADARALVDWAAPLQRWAAAHPNPVETPLPAADLQALACALEPIRQTPG